jgi:hypothetical protein
MKVMKTNAETLSFGLPLYDPPETVTDDTNAHQVLAPFLYGMILHST